nr:endonuclease/exonuclease/phosphatase family protein [Kineococcus vitellinus]
MRVATFNTSAAAGAQGLRTLLEQARPDVVALQEVADRQRADLARSHPRYPHRSDDGSGGPRGGGDGLVLSRWPVLEVRPVTGLPAGARPADVVVLDVDGRRLAVLSVHLASPCLFCPERSVRRNPAGDTGSAARVRVAEARRYGEVARELRAGGNAVVLAGDLNSAELNEPLRSLTRSGLTDVHRAVGTRPQLTRGSSPGFARVDVVLVSGLVPLADGELGPGGSTHSPVVADLAWP